MSPPYWISSKAS